jgi:hypothetical protein
MELPEKADQLDGSSQRLERFKEANKAGAVKNCDGS